jgi:hypothetical protein
MSAGSPCESLFETNFTVSNNTQKLEAKLRHSGQRCKPFAKTAFNFDSNSAHFQELPFEMRISQTNSHLN